MKKQKQDKEKAISNFQNKKIHRGESDRKLKTTIIVSAAIVVCVILAVMALVILSDFTGIGGSTMQKDVSIPKGASVSVIADRLAQSGVIRSSLAFNLYVRAFQKDAKFNYGIYSLSSDMGYDKIVSELEKIATRKETAKVVIPEGFNAYEVADAMEKAGICSADSFIGALKTGTYNYSFISSIKADSNRYLKLEGYLFPDTYDFEFESDPVKVIDTMLANFEKKITNTLKDRAKELGMTLDQVVTLASVIQSEVGSIATEEKKVSSVFHNRLNDWGDYPYLESDVTIFYGRDVIKANYPAASQAMIDSYNTYVHPGLPTGPICNPGISAIEATLYPESTKYYYFVTDINSKFYYATTFADHQKNVAVAFAVK